MNEGIAAEVSMGRVKRRVFEERRKGPDSIFLMWRGCLIFSSGMVGLYISSRV